MTKEQNNERYTLCLVLSDDLKIDIEFAQSEDIDRLCSNLKDKYKFSYGVKDRLKEHIQNFLTNQVSLKKEEEIRKKILNQKIINKLYYQSIEARKKKEQCMSIMKEKEIMKEIGEQYFTPKILFYPNDSERQHYKIEEKLLKAGQISKEKKLMRKIEDDLKMKEKIARERRKNLDLMSKSSREYQKKVRSESRKNLLKNEHLEPPITENNNNYVEDVVTTKQDLTNNNKTFSMMNSNEDNKNFSLKDAFKNEKQKKYLSIHKSRILSGNNNQNSSNINAQANDNNSLPTSANNTSNLKNPKKLSVNNNLSFSQLPNTSQVNLNEKKNNNNSILQHKTLDSSALGAMGISNNYKNPQDNLKSGNNSSNNFNNNTTNFTNNMLKENCKDQKENLKDNNQNSALNDTVSKISSKVGILRSKSIHSGELLKGDVLNVPLDNSDIKEKNNTQKQGLQSTLNKNINEMRRDSTSLINLHRYSPPRSTSTNKVENTNSHNNMNYPKNNLYLKENNQNKSNQSLTLNNSNQVTYFKNHLSTGKSHDSVNQSRGERMFYKSVEMRKKREKVFKRIQKNEFTFTPSISRKFNDDHSKKESQNEFFTRLSTSKKLTDINNTLKRGNSFKNQLLGPNSFISNNTSSSPQRQLDINNRRQSKRSLNLNFSGEVHTKNKDKKDDTLKIMIGHFRRPPKKQKTPIYLKKDKESKDIITKDLINNLQIVEKTEKIMKQNFSKKVIQNINKFKIEKLKEIYEIVLNKCDNIDDLDAVTDFGISKHIKDKLVSPTCQIMMEKQMEFNFQNFSLIANEIMKLLV